MLAVKKGQPTLYADVVAAVGKALAAQFAGLKHAALITEDVGHGREEARTYTAIYDPPGSERPLPLSPEGAA